MRGKITLLLIILLIASTGFAKQPSRYSPVGTHMAQSSLVSVYYREFVDMTLVGVTLASQSAFESFCKVLGSSQILADQLGEAGISRGELTSLLAELRRIDVSKEEFRTRLIQLDLMLEKVLVTVGERSRDEFRREVLRNIPPMTYFGTRELPSTDAIAMLIN